MASTTNRFCAKFSKQKILLAVCFFTLFISITSPHAYAQTTNIVTLQAPIHVPITSRNPVIAFANVSYSGAGAGFTLVVGVLDEAAAQPTAVSAEILASPYPCQSNLSLTLLQSTSLCAIPLQNSSGNEQLQVKIGLLGSNTTLGTRKFALSVILLDEKGNAISESLSSVPFQVDVTATPLLYVKVPDAVSVSVDGVALHQGSVDGISLTVGPHILSVPTIVSVNNNTRLRFDHWTDGLTSPNRSVLAQSDIGLEAVYVSQYPLILNSSLGVTSGAGWYDSNSNATFSVSPNTVPLPGILGMLGGRLTVQGWYENGNLIASSATGTIAMNQGHTLAVLWQSDYTIPEAVAALAIMIIVGVISFRAKTGTRPKKKRSKSA